MLNDETIVSHLPSDANRESGANGMQQAFKKAICLVVVVVASAGAAWLMLGGNHKVQLDRAQLHWNDAIKTVVGTGKRTLIVFERADCSYCQKLEPELSALHDTTIYKFIVAGSNEHSKESTRSIWCSPSPAIAWSVHTKGGPLPPAQCDMTSIDRNTAILTAAGTTRTPTLIFTNDDSNVGYMSAADIEQRLAAAEIPGH